MAQVFAIVGPSGAGKDTLMAGAALRRPELRVVRRVITRPAEAGGEPFDGVTGAEFQRRLDAGDFALDWQAHGLRYGIPASELAAEIVLFNGSRVALPVAVARLPGLVVVMVTAPVAVLAQRLAARGRETAADVAARLQRAGFDLPPGIVPRIVVNDTTPEVGVERLLAALHPVRG